MKTREWLLVLLVVILVQFIVQGSAWIYGSNSSALGYISFAGTIVSIILAVLAIVYSFVQSITQQNSSNTISRQVEKLIDVTNSVDTSKNELGLSLNKLYDVSEAIEKSLSEQEKIHSTVRTIDEKVESLGQDILRHVFDLSEHKGRPEADGFASQITRGHNGLIMCSLTLFFGNKNRLTYEDTSENLLPYTLDFIATNNEDEKNDLVRFYRGMLLGTYQSFCAFGLVTETENQFELSDSFIQVSNEFLSELESSDGVDEILSTVVERLENYAP